MPKLIVVQGTSNSGKSHSIEEFVRAHRGIHLHHFPAIVVAPITKGRPITLGVGKNGDNASEVTRTLDLFHTHHCDIVVCATKSSGASVVALNTFLLAHPLIVVARVSSIFVPPYIPGIISPAQAAANSRVAADIEANIP